MENMAALLRKATQSIHQKVEETRVVRQALAPEANQASYIALLQGFYQAHSRLGNWRQNLSGLTYSPFDRIQRLQADLEFLGASIPTEIEPTVLQAPQAWGVAYVVEGSVLGAAVIRSVYLQKLPLGLETGGSYLWGYGPQNRAHWSQFCAQLDAWGSQFPQSVEQAQEAARGAFGVFCEALQ